MKTNIYFAPIQGYTDAAYRECFEKVFGGITQYYTPFIRVEKGFIRRQDSNDISKERNHDLIEKDLITPQILPGNENEMRFLADEISGNGYKRMDINFGCPFPMIAKRHKGSGILPYPNELAAILDVTKEYPDISFSIKMRLGYKSENEWEELTDIINDTPLEHITVHARTGVQQYGGEIRLNPFEKLYSQLKGPIIYNGDIIDLGSAKNILDKFPQLKGIMIGRGLLRNPALATEINKEKFMETKELVSKIKEFNSMLIECYTNYYDGGEGQVLKKMQLLWEYMLPELDKKYRKKILKSNTLDEYRQNSEIALSNYCQTEY